MAPLLDMTLLPLLGVAAVNSKILPAATEASPVSISMIREQFLLAAHNRTLIAAIAGNLTTPKVRILLITLIAMLNCRRHIPGISEKKPIFA